jgi:hypothetical protein
MFCHQTTHQHTTVGAMPDTNDEIVLTPPSRHCESQHSFFYCKICCMGFKSKQDEGAHLQRCRSSCISPDCTFVKSISETDDPRKYRHEKTPECPNPTRGSVETQHRLDYLKHLFLSVFSISSSHTSRESSDLVVPGLGQHADRREQ